jgi:hypothetical protein
VEQIFDKTSGKIVPVTDKDVLATLDPETFKIVSEIPVLPGAYYSTPKVAATLIACLVGFLIVFFMDFYKKGKL